MSSQIRDPIYGDFELPSYLDELLSCWEIQRLRYVRLINVNSVPLSSLGEVSRFSHILGVLHLGVRFLRKHDIAIDGDVGRTLLATLALHDIGTPAFAHSLEYVLKAQTNKNHVDTAVAALNGVQQAGPLQWSCIPTRNQHGRLRSELKRLVGRDFVEKIGLAIQGQGTLGYLVSSDGIDLDNLDNVFRMAYSLGLREWTAADVFRILESLELTSSQTALGGDYQSLESVIRWAILRRSAYEVLNFHPGNLAGLAMLRELFEVYSQQTGILDESAWWSTDSELLERMRTPYTTDLIDRIVTGKLYRTAATLWIDTSDAVLSPIEAISRELSLFSHKLSQDVDRVVRVHCILDKGTFQRSIQFHVYGMGTEKLGENSRSVILAIHTPSESEPPSRDRVFKATLALLSERFGLSIGRLEAALKRKPRGFEIGESPDQLGLFSPIDTPAESTTPGLPSEVKSEA